MKRTSLLALGILLVAAVASAQPSGNQSDWTHFPGPNPSGPQPWGGWIQPFGPPLWDNGAVDGVNGYSNATAAVFGFRRTVLGDFVVPPGETWSITDYTWRHVWNSLPAGSGTDGELRFLADLAGTPDFGTQVGTATPSSSYTEVATGNTFFSRPEAESFISFTPVVLGPGTYWVDITIVGPENNFYLTAPQNNGTDCWIDYADLGTTDCFSQFGQNEDINFRLGGTSIIPAELTGFEVE